MGIKGYRLLQHEDPNLKDGTRSDWRPTAPYTLSKLLVSLLVFLLFTSFSLNGIWAYQRFQTEPECNCESPTIYAGLSRDVSVLFAIDKVFDSKNRSIADEAWKSPLLIPETGLVALSDDWVASKSLPKSQRFPWDKSKGIYLLNGFHNMHCLQLLRQSTLDAFDGKPQTLPRRHISHCINLFREEILCNADDTPRYTGRLNQQASARRPVSGIGQTRQCRDWGKLREWAIEHSACYKPIGLDDPDIPLQERYKFCPNGEKLWP